VGSNKLKSHLGRGSLVDQLGNALAPIDFLSIPSVKNGFEGLKGYDNSENIIPPLECGVKNFTIDPNDEKSLFDTVYNVYSAMAKGHQQKFSRK
jgi:hypothetical protein